MAREEGQRALKIAQQIGDKWREASIWHQMASIDIFRGEYEEARQKSLTSLEIWKEIDGRADEAEAWRDLGLIAQKLGNSQSALVNFRNALEIKREIDDEAGEASIWSRIGPIYKDQEDYDAAVKCFQKALEIFLEIEDVNGIGSTFGQLGITASRRGRTAEGLRLVTLGAMILGPRESDNFEIVESWANGLASELNYTQEQFDAMSQELVEAYQKDNGWSLIDAAFADVEP